MSKHAPAAARRWQATIIIALFFVAVVAAAGIGWWYARESPPHQGPIVLIAVDGLPASGLAAYGARAGNTPAIDALAADAVIFERAYAHSPLLLPAHASLVSGQLPFEHGVRDEAGFTLKPEARTVAELLRNRGFNTGGAVSSFLLRRESGVAQGFAYFDGELPAQTDRDEHAPAVERPGTATLDAAERWARTQGDQRFLLSVQVNAADADTAVSRLTQLLRERRLYDKATIVLVGERGDAGAGASLDDAALHVPLLIKQPDADAAGHRVSVPVQQIDLLPTILDLVRAPIPGGLRGRSLRPLLDEDASINAQPIYAESLAAYLRFGGAPAYALTTETERYVRGGDEHLTPVGQGDAEPSSPEQPDASLLRGTLDRLIAGKTISPPAPLAEADQQRFAAAGYIAGLPAAADSADAPPLPLAQQHRFAEMHRDAARFIGARKFGEALATLRQMIDGRPDFGVVRYQVGLLLARTGRLEEAATELGAAAELRPDAWEIPATLADVLARNGRNDEAAEQAEAAVALAARTSPRAAGAAHDIAARVALARKDAPAAAAHAGAARTADPSLPTPQFVKGRLLFDEGKYDEALAAFREAAALSRQQNIAVRLLHQSLGETLVHLDEFADAETAFREELRSFPGSVQPYASLATLYHAASRDAEAEALLEELVVAVPTPEGYALAARLWTILGDRSRAETIRGDARVRFRGDPSLALLGRDGRR